MSSIFPIFILIALLATVGVLIAGIIVMARGGEFNAKYSNKLMRARVFFQFLAVALIALFALFAGKG
ncbi:MAG: hypothetical protein CMM48_15750 [Rhodospirillaceae bacterium]|nr:hypothetical protein [Rhodospirillaceae bacterium]MBL25338.1 hypothetical protein [Rhodospirillaceae bacterium]